MANKIEKIERRISMSVDPSLGLTGQNSSNTPQKDKKKRGSVILKGGQLPLIQ